MENTVNSFIIFKECTEFGNISTVSRMIWGCQWDQICRFISDAKDENGKQISLGDSRNYGNYNNSIDNATTSSGTENFNDTTGKLNNVWKLKNIYDLAGNCCEWTQEAYKTNYRAFRGGSYADGGKYGYVSSRLSTKTPNGSYRNVSSRPVLYIK